MSQTLSLMLKYDIIGIPKNSFGLQSYCGKFGFPDDNTEFEILAYDDDCSFFNVGDTIRWTSDRESVNINISQIRNNGHTIFCPSSYALPQDITDINLLCAFLWYACRKFTKISSCDKFWFQQGMENKNLLPWEQQWEHQRLALEAEQKRIEESSFYCLVDSGYGHAFRSKIYQLIIKTYYEALADNNGITRIEIPKTRSETKKALNDEVVISLKSLFKNHSISFSHNSNILTATIWVGNHMHKTQVLAESNRKWPNQFSIDAFEFLAKTSNIFGQLRVGIFDYDNDGTYVLSFGDRKFEVQISQLDLVDCTDEALEKAQKELFDVLEKKYNNKSD